MLYRSAQEEKMGSFRLKMLIILAIIFYIPNLIGQVNNVGIVGVDSGYLAIVGDFSKYESNSLKDFIYESNKQGRINFVPHQDEAIRSLIK